ncbi:2-succinyl-5-enolpyruvyl-6-hydroxy-3-cyclohexene-1-carboxylic-acid synthase [Arcanobacterium buesumense]|uniref:2-succinyl-5-enolpyruvyl-6-hydroxy-3-cyclohexene-1-carboxylate synthase n=1 Tax=Arcanobacterium buesumense TaxID=2722751 RepID=A0A6H2EK04_9ACTO|nr:2-succinyl-5-enolpyruvyl-6-hydroxy-3-cyclohexene-1-carboxylic-acid synthase [Arcanobacterium buesumense]
MKGNNVVDSTKTARTILAHLIAHGVETFILCPGSRSAPFAYALYDAERAGLIHLHVETDERVAGFVALGAGSAGKIAAVVTTSGSAVANLHPAVEEAYYGGIPMIVLSSDRPPHMRGVRASQTTDHQAVLAGSVRHFREFPAGGSVGNIAGLITRAVGTALGRFTGSVPGPVHLNVSFVEPLMPDGTWSDISADIAQAQSKYLPVESTDVRCVIIAGTTVRYRDLDPHICAGIPVLAEPCAPWSCHPHAINAHPVVLNSALRSRINRAIVIGHPTLTREVSALLADESVEVFVLDDAPTYADVAGRARVITAAQLADVAVSNPDWLRAWQAASDAIGEYIDEHVTQLSYASIGRNISRFSDGVELVVGASSIIREMNIYQSMPAQPVHANRGLAGIDGTVSTAIGIGLATGRGVRVVVGDLTFIHDIGALIHTAGQQGIDLDVVVIDDAGGSLFSTLEYGQGEPEPYDRVFRTAKELDIRAYAQAVGVNYQVVQEQAELVTALQQAPCGVRIVHIALGYTPMADERRIRSTQREGMLAAVHARLKGFQ